MKNILILLILIISLNITSCNVRKSVYKVISKGLVNNASIECDSTDLIMITTKFDYDFFSHYKLDEHRKNNDNLYNHHPYLTWLDNNQKWILDDFDIKSMMNTTSKIVLLNQKKIVSNQIINLVDFPLYINEIEKNKDVTKSIINCNYLYQISLPIFNKKNNKAVVMIKSINFNITTYYILFKKNNEWYVAGQTNNYTE